MIYGVVPARSGSKGIQDKNIKKLQNVPLLAYSIVASRLSKEITKTIFTTDSNAYLDVAYYYDNNIIQVKRPDWLATDTSTDTDYLLHLVYKLDLDESDTFVILRPTTPLRQVKTIDGIIKTFCFSHYFVGFDSLRSIQKMQESPHKVYKRIDTESESIEKHSIIGEISPYLKEVNNETSNMPRQDFKQAYHPNGFCDIVRVGSLIRNKTIYGNKIYGFLTENVHEIDYLDDFEMNEYMIEKTGSELLNFIKDNYK